MGKGNGRLWMTRVGAVALITVPAVLCSTLPASAAPPTAIASASYGEVRSSTTLAGSASVVASAGGATSLTAAESDTRSLGSLVRAAIDALKRVPVLWNKVAAGVKKSYAWFTANVWPTIKATVQFISGLITAWDIWKYFN